MKKILISLLLVASNVSFAQAMDIETKKAQIQNAFDSVALDLQQDQACLAQFSGCMDQVCTSPRADRCVCASYFDDSIIPQRKKLLDTQEQTAKILEQQIPALQENKTTTSNDNIFDLSSLSYTSITANLFTTSSQKSVDFPESGTTLYNKALKNCETIAKSCGTSSDKIKNMYNLKIDETCNQYLYHLGDEEEIIDYENQQAQRLLVAFQNIATGGTYNILTCTNKLKEFYVKECSGFDYRNCIKCESVNSQYDCNNEIKKNFSSLKTKAFNEIGQKCGSANFETSYNDFMAELDGNSKANFKLAQKSSDKSEDGEIREYVDTMTTCVSDVCGLTWEDCKTQSAIDSILASTCARTLNNLEARFKSKPQIITEIKTKVQININRLAKTRGIDLQYNSSSLYD
jgi:hypothetical protein